MKCQNCGETEDVILHVVQIGPEWRVIGKLTSSINIEDLLGMRALMMGQSGILTKEEVWEPVDENEQEELVVDGVFCGNCGQTLVD